MAYPVAPHLSLLTAYRVRAEHLELLLAWLGRIRQSEGFADFELILAEGAERPTAGAFETGGATSRSGDSKEPPS